MVVNPSLSTELAFVAEPDTKRYVSWERHYSIVPQSARFSPLQQQGMALLARNGVDTRPNPAVAEGLQELRNRPRIPLKLIQPGDLVGWIFDKPDNHENTIHFFEVKAVEHPRVGKPISYSGNGSRTAYYLESARGTLNVASSEHGLQVDDYRNFYAPALIYNPEASDSIERRGMDFPFETKIMRPWQFELVGIDEADHAWLQSLATPKQGENSPQQGQRLMQQILNEMRKPPTEKVTVGA
jgi:hypothetical protein